MERLQMTEFLSRIRPSTVVDLAQSLGFSLAASEEKYGDYYDDNRGRRIFVPSNQEDPAMPKCCPNYLKP